MDKCREEFEEWLGKSRIGNPWKKTEPGYTNEYSDPYVNLMWKAWKASRENMKAIKLPGHGDPLKDKTIMFISDVKKLLESEGINVEVEQ